LEVFIGRGVAIGSWQLAVGKEQLARSSWQFSTLSTLSTIFNNLQQPSTSPPSTFPPNF
jgi:hypothetical protein